MKNKLTFSALIFGALITLSGCGDKSDNASEKSSVVSEISFKTTDIFNIKSRGDMAVTLYYDVEEPTISFIMPDGTVLDTKELPTERGDGAVCYHIADAALGQWQMNYDKKNNNSLDVNWAPDITADWRL